MKKAAIVIVAIIVTAIGVVTGVVIRTCNNNASTSETETEAVVQTEAVVVTGKSSWRAHYEQLKGGESATTSTTTETLTTCKEEVTTEVPITTETPTTCKEEVTTEAPITTETPTTCKEEVTTVALTMEPQTNTGRIGVEELPTMVNSDSFKHKTVMDYSGITHSSSLTIDESYLRINLSQYPDGGQLVFTNGFVSPDDEEELFCYFYVEDWEGDYDGFFEKYYLTTGGFPETITVDVPKGVRILEIGTQNNCHFDSIEFIPNK